MKILYGCEFWKVDKLSLLQTSVNDHWLCILSDTRVSGDSLTEAARDEDQLKTQSEKSERPNLQLRENT